MADSDPQVAELKAAQVEFTGYLNEAIEQMRNPDGTMSSTNLIAMQSVLIMSAGFNEGLLHCNGRILTGNEGKRMPINIIASLYQVGYEFAEAEFLKHGADMEALIKQRLVAMQTKVI